MTLCGLMDVSPWTKPDLAKKFENGVWADWPYSEQLCSTEGSVWILLLMLLSSEEVWSGHYDLSIKYRCDRILKLRQRLSQTVIDQIPPLQQLRQSLEELAFNSTSGRKAFFGSDKPNIHLGPLAIVETEQTKYEELKETTSHIPLSIEPITDFAQLQFIARAKVDIMESYDSFDTDAILPRPVLVPHVPSKLRCNQCHKSNVEDRCSVCKKVYYCSRECQVNDWPSHRTSCGGYMRLWDGFCTV
jgi:zinc finger MYND domain-containing protein 10